MSQKMGFFVLKTSEADQKKTALLPVLDVVATVILYQGRVLTVYNKKWGAFTLPTTKRRSWEDDAIAKGAVREEPWENAAARAAAEWLGHTLTATLTDLGEVPEFQQSDRDGKWKRYRLKAYLLDLDAEPSIPPMQIVEWLSPDDILDEKRMPISPTARHIVSYLQLKGVLSQ